MNNLINTTAYDKEYVTFIPQGNLTEDEWEKVLEKRFKELDSTYRKDYALYKIKTDLYKDYSDKKAQDYIEEMSARGLYLYISALENDTEENYTTPYYLNDVYKTFYVLLTHFSLVFNPDNLSKKTMSWLKKSRDIFYSLEDRFISNKPAYEQYKSKIKNMILNGEDVINTSHFPVKIA